jgi:hypothetical protein
MGWLLSEVTAVLVIVAVATVTLQPRARRPFARAGRAITGRAAGLGLWPVAVPPPEHRPIEVIAREARRLGRQYRATRTGVSFAKFDAVRRAYDDVLGEGCAALGVPHLLAVLEAGDELDAERARVERLLHIWGVSLDDAA